jgi:TetR/AcrR family transcriptional regulator, transcriptional repressor for nem operon
MKATRQPRALATREKILREATQLFTVKGYHGTKLEEVLRAAGVTTGAFFHHFRSKEELAFAVLDWYTEQRRHELDQIEGGLRPAASDDPLEPVFRWLEATQQRFRRRAERKEGGCIFGNLSAALCDTHDGFRERLAAAFDQMALDFKPRLDEAARQCCPERRLDTLALARYIVAVIEGSILLARAHQDSRFMARHFQFLKEYLRQAFHS